MRRAMLLVVVIVTLPLVVPLLVHEIGHLIAARLCGFSVLYVRVGGGPLVLSAGPFELRALPTSGHTGFSGGVPEAELPVGKSIAVMLSGVLANLLVSAVVYVIVPVWSWAGIAVAAPQLILGATNLIPVAGTDGARCLEMIRRASKP